MNGPNTNAVDYKAAGYCLFREVLDPEEVLGLNAELDSLVRNMPDTMVVYKDGKNQEVPARPEYLTEPHASNNAWLELCRQRSSW